jgi:peptidoglycan hydrolase-like protein with peptidoglycan-binding domain
MPNTTNSASDPNAILFEYNPSGASFATAKQDGLAQKGIIGPKASKQMAANDAKRALPHKEKFAIAAQQFGLPPALLAAIASRESRAGGVLDKKGFGDFGNAFGLMQVDKRFHQIEGLPDPTSLQHIIQAAGILAGFRDAVAKKHPDWPDERQLQGAVAAYNSGVGNIQTLDGMDKGTTGNDYSNDVWARALFFAEQMGSVAPSTPSTTVASLQPLAAMLAPAPALADVEAGTSVLQRNQQGDTVVTLQQTLMKFSYLELSEEEQATGLGIFGPKTELAVQSFQRDVYLPPSGAIDLVTFHAARQILDQTVKKDADNHVGIVRRMQDRLAELKQIKASDIGTAYGTFGSKTDGALKSFQKEKGFEQSGVLTVETYLALRASAPNAPPVLDLGSGDNTRVESQLPNAGPGFFAKGGATQRSAQFGTERTLNRLMAFAAVWMSKHPDRPLRIGEMSVKGGGKFGAHVGAGHKGGFAVDIGLFRKDGQNLGVTFRDAIYDRALTRELVAALDESPNVFFMVYNDTQITGAKLSRDKTGKHIHDNHVHVEFQSRTGK